jgi:PhnB protein
MEGNGHTMWGRFVYGNIKRPDLLEFVNSFSNEKGEIARADFDARWPLEIFNRMTLTEKDNKTTLSLVGYPLNSTEEEYEFFQSMKANVNGGFNKTFDQLDAYLEAQFKIRKEAKTDKKARVCTYLNFDGNTEEAFKFYQSVFKTEFGGKGVQRFGDIPQDAGHPPVTDSIKKMILHIELPTIGGHVLMGTDAPKEMGFELTFGNNSHICLEPESREEAKKLFDALSAGGNVTMPLQDMFFGSYFGEFTDKFGVKWMVNYNN